MDFYLLLRSHFSKLSVGGVHIVSGWGVQKTCPLHQDPSSTGCSSLHSQLRQWRGGEDTMGGLGGQVRRGEGQEGGWGGGKGVCMGHTHTRTQESADTHTHTHAGQHTDRRRVARRERSHRSAIRLSLSVRVCGSYGVRLQDCMDPCSHTHTHTHTHTHARTQTPHHGQSGSCLSLHSPLRHYWWLELIPQQWVRVHCHVFCVHLLVYVSKSILCVCVRAC